MPYHVALTGLPSAGKSSLFQALTGKEVPRADYPFSTVEPNEGVFPLPDEGLEILGRLTGIAKRSPASLILHDVAGLVEGAHRGEGMGNEFLSHIREADLLLLVVPCFDAPWTAANKEGSAAASEVIFTEFLLADLALVEKAIPKWEKQARLDRRSGEDLRRIREAKALLERGEAPFGLKTPLPLFTQKPLIVVANGTDESAVAAAAALARRKGVPFCQLDADFLCELAVMPPAERGEMLAEMPALRRGMLDLTDNILRALSLVRFYTLAGGREIRAHLVSASTPCVEAAGKVHSQMQEGFIRAEALSFDDFTACGSWEKAKAKGLVRTRKKEDRVRDRDVLLFHFH